MKPTGIVKDAVFLKHDMGPYHPENPRRLEVIYEAIAALNADLLLTDIPTRVAQLDEIAAVHTSRHVERIAGTAGIPSTFFDADTSACADTWDAASRAVGGLLNLLDAVVKGDVRNGFAFVRPPGHHAERGRAMGFCFFNNIALAARYAIARLGLDRVAIVDWDLHHGNGTQHAFYDDPAVLFISTHQYPHYPGTGRLRETGEGPGEGYTVNIPLEAGADDKDYLAAFHMIVAPVVEAFRPDLILVSAGFDAHRRDPLGGMKLTADGYGQLTEVLMHLAAEFCSGRLVLTLEGGYDPNALQESVVRVLTGLASYDPERSDVPLRPGLEDLNPRTARVLREVLAVQRQYWPTVGFF
ncbi:MAG: histone deacetylase [Pseudomonadota bacterium]